MPVVISGTRSVVSGKTPVPSGLVVSAGFVVGFSVGFVTGAVVTVGFVVVAAEPVVSGFRLQPVKSVATNKAAIARTVNFFIH